MTPLFTDLKAGPKIAFEVEVQLSDMRTRNLAAMAILKSLLSFAPHLLALSVSVDGRSVTKEGGLQQPLKEEIEGLIKILETNTHDSFKSRLLPLLP